MSSQLRVAAFIGARVFVAPDGHYSTDSSLVYELVELARHVDQLTLHCFVIESGQARDRLHIPPSIRLADLGHVTCGKDLYGHPLRLWRRVRQSVRHGGWSHAVIAEPGLTSLFALLTCYFARRPVIALIRGDPAVGAMAHRYRRGAGVLVGKALRRFSILVKCVLAASVPVITDSDVVGVRLSRRGTVVHYLVAASISAAEVLPPARAWPGAGRGPMRLLFVGRLERIKGIETLLQAVQAVAATGRDLRLQIVGSGDPAYTAELYAQVSGLGLAEVVTFTGAVPHGPQLYALYRDAHLLTISSYSEGIPKVAIEAMSHGVPVVASAVGGLPRIVPPEVGILVPPANAEAFMKAVVTVYDSPALALRMSRAARESAASMLAEPVSRKLAWLLSTTARPPGFGFRAALGKGA
jgi:glycosyltransferase involved in cell wall biosynthesis